MTQLWVGALLLIIAAGLMFIVRPNRPTGHPRFLQFDAAMVLYPPLILVFLAFGTAAIVAWLLSSH